MRLAVALVLLPGLVVGLTVHECAHALAASLLGDDFPRRQKRVSLNPFRHLSLAGTLAIFFLPFGWGRPVVFNPYNLRRPRRDALLIALAGPASNLLLAAAVFALMQLTRHSFMFGSRAAPLVELVHALLAMVLLINVVLAVFNLLPIPPLDGGHIWRLLKRGPMMTPRTARRSWLFVAVLVALLWSGSIGKVIDPVIGTVTGWMPPSDRDVVDRLVEQGKQAVHDGKPKVALDLLARALATDPENLTARYCHAWACYQTDHFDRALNEVDSVLAEDPLFGEARWLRALVLHELGRDEEALQVANRALALDKDNADYQETRDAILKTFHPAAGNAAPTADAPTERPDAAPSLP